MSDRPKLAVYWAASCGGCEVSILNMGEFFLELDRHFDFIICPCLLDTKKTDIESLPDGAIDLTLFNGAIRTGENEEMARLLRRKSSLLAAFGSCAIEGCIPGLSNLSNRDQHFQSIYLDNLTTDNPDGIIPGGSVSLPDGVITLPEFYERVLTLHQVVPVDFSIPGCPPEPRQIRQVLEAYLAGEPPAAGSLVGCGDLTVCDDCDRVKCDKKIPVFYRNHEIIPDRQICLLEQGLLCIGIATRNGCGAPCTQANMPCTGCYGPPPGVQDQGAKMVAALASVMDIGSTKGLSETEIADRVDAFLDAIPDYAGQFYKYGLAGSILGGRLRE
ncbi:MAG: NADH:ubiquinone oxidoreductase [Geobacter sp.]|nr:NADH:ubiquinone oxidoreductase [Geobacter sp.]